MRGFVAANDKLGTIVISFRGSHNFLNWVENLNICKVDSDVPNAPSDVRVHSGFQNTWSAVRSQTLAALETLHAAHPTYSLTFTGHSLGAAVATLAAIDLVSTNSYPASSITLITQGEPRIGNAAFGAYVRSFPFAGVYRGVHYNDIVPHLPPESFGFSHHAGEEWIDAGDKTVWCDDGEHGGEDTDCANTTPPWLSASAHMVYFGVAMGGGSC
ncbi:hypothetical protein HK101_003316 [Irineochytrium annulatum]|nr:hypothetical protein HK101_003316 [Irineochytrium annulatum]